MHAFLVFALVVIVGGWALSRMIRRFHSTAGTATALLTGLVGRIAVVVVMVDSTAKAVGHGGWFIALAALFVLIGVGAVLTTVATSVALWLLVSGRASE